MATNYREFPTTPTPTGGKDEGKVYRLYDAQPTREELRELLPAGWRAVDLSSGQFANTTLKREALKISATGRGLIYTKG